MRNLWQNFLNQDWNSKRTLAASRRKIKSVLCKRSTKG
nr:MAG TPA: hypothetical protein [Caudoviricetes sp.]